MANNLKLIRIKAGLNQSELAEKIGCPQTTISKYETGALSIENMTLKMATAIAEACGCTIEDLFKEDVKMTKRDVVDFIKTKFEEAEKEFEEAVKNGAKASEHFKITENTYKECKDIAEKNGYVGSCFEQLWQKAVEDDAHKKGLHPNN